MLPQNGQQRAPQQQQAGPGFGGFMGQGSQSFEGQYFGNLDASQAAKQMAALNAAKQARMAANPRASSAGLASAGGTSSGSYFGGINNFPPQNPDLLSSGGGPHARLQIPNNHATSSLPINQSLLDPSMSHHPNSRSAQQQRQQGFLLGLHNLMVKLGQPLPPALTGIPAPNYNPSTSPWSHIEPGSEVGSLKLAGKDVNLFRLWSAVFQSGGGQVLSANNGWPSLLPHFDLPEEFPSVQANGSSSVATMLHQIYMSVLYQFEDSYRKNMQENQRKANVANRPGNMMPNAPMSGGQPIPQQVNPANPAQMQRPMSQVPQASPVPNGMPRYPSMPPQPSRPPSGVMPGGDPTLQATQTPDLNLLDQDGQGIKRKFDTTDLESKRARPRTDLQTGNPMVMPPKEQNPSELPSQLPQAAASTPPRPRQQPSRRKIEYVPLAREVDTYGGRDLRIIETELNHGSQRRPLRELNDWGTVDIECLTMSIRSRLGPELSYALTTFALLSTMRGQTPGSGFPIFQCVDLLEEALDLVEDTAFEGPETTTATNDTSGIVTNHQLVTLILDTQSHPFASLEDRQGFKAPEDGLQQRPAHYILAVLNVVRNLSTVPDNVEFLAKHVRLLDIFLRLCAVVQENGTVKPASPALSLNDLVLIRKDVLYTLSTLAGLTTLAASNSPKMSIRITKRIFDLVASYLVDPTEAVQPSGTVQQAGMPVNSHTRPPTLADVALETFNRFSQPDHNRKLLVQAVSHPRLWGLFEALVHRLPISDADFQLIAREPWLSYVEKTIMAIYSLSFMAPPDLKQKMRNDRVLGFKSVMARLLHKFLVNNTHDGRMFFMVCSRRITETLKVLDDALDPFENPVDSAVPALSFGMGFADATDSGLEKGTGLLGAHRDSTWEMLMLREVQGDEIMFNELESLVRVECQ
ncbi:hypothetical protein FA15DRAFT_607990 [Coprinopsis marcescibilis]|uniref:ARID domain-containing protein n=1 Tax=Coprinopsis marcescibilis TaxID=230819 RepID=A0A5C3LBY4_COPMA|nr:hypothetical protein FA15DRAFT_607990 [Coprinopsis marcescibilis]